jgi:hypothetical protein
MPQSTSKSSVDQAGTAGAAMRLEIHEVEPWIKALPLADVGATYHRVSAALSQLNNGDLPSEERFAALELFRGTIQYLSEGLKHHFVGASFPLALKARGIATQLYALHLEMAGGYQSIADELLELTALRRDFTMLATSLHRSLYYLNQGLLIHYQIYEPDNSECWRRIHRGYEAAERKGVQASIVKDPYRQNKQSTTIEDQYKQILLLALANPYRHSQADMTRIHLLLEHWTALCHFHPTDAFDEQQHACFVDLAGDEPPGYIAYSSVPLSATCRILDTSALIQTLRNSIARIPDAPPDHPSKSGTPQTTIRWRDLVQSLISAWGMITKRRFSRLPPKMPAIGINLGLSAIHQLIGNVDPMPSGETGGGDQWPEAPGIRNADAIGSVNNTEDSGAFLCEVINESAGGSRLRWHNTNKGKIRIGELVAVHHPHESGEMPGIATIRWLKTISKHTVEFGVQLLSPDAIPINIRLYDGKNQESGHDYLKGLYIPEFKATRQPASLILPAFLYHADDIVSLMMDDQEHCLRLVKTIETTQGYSRFLFAALDTSDKAHH